MKTLNTILLIIITSLLLSSCLATNTATESSISKKITSNVIPQKVNQTSLFYPRGAYNTFNDFKNRTPSNSISFNKSQLKHILSSNYQLKFENGKRVKKPFAVSNGRELFVRVYHIKKQMEKKYKGKPSDANRDYLLAYYVNNQFLYFENEFVSDYGIVTKFARYGIIYNNKTKEFIVLDRNSNINKFIKDNFPNLKDKYFFSNKKVNLNKVRELMNEMFNE